MKEFVDNLYPTELKLSHTIGDGITTSTLCGDKTLLYTIGAIELIIQIDSPEYRKEDVCEAVKEICQKAIEYYN